MLTERVIREAKPDGRTRILWDATVKGFGVKVSAGGAKRYVIDYRTGSRQRRATIGRVGELSLRNARQRAARELASIRGDGHDPLETRREEREAPTVGEGLDRFFGEFAPERVRLGRMAPKTIREYSYAAKRYIRPALGALKVASVTRRHVERMVSGLARTQRNRVLAFTSRVFRQFERWEWREQNTNPARGVERARETPRDRTLAPSELAALARALDDMAGAYPASVAAIRFAAVTGLRIGEVLAIRWEDVDLEQSRLTMPETKTGRRQHDLPAAAVAILRGLMRVNDCPWAFTTTGRAALSYRPVHVHFGEAVGAAGLADVRLHDLRRTVMTRAAAAGVGTHILRDLLGHKTTAMADRYVRAVGSPVRDAREAIGAEIAAVMAVDGAPDWARGREIQRGEPRRGRPYPR